VSHSRTTVSPTKYSYESGNSCIYCGTIFDCGSLITNCDFVWSLQKLECSVHIIQWINYKIVDGCSVELLYLVHSYNILSTINNGKWRLEKAIFFVACRTKCVVVKPVDFAQQRLVMCRHNSYNASLLPSVLLSHRPTCLTDASEVFDTIDHCTLFEKLLDWDLPAPIARFLLKWYHTQMLSVHWSGHVSRKFIFTSDIRQGVSPILFTVYIETLIAELRSSGWGCYWEVSLLVNCVMLTI